MKNPFFAFIFALIGALVFANKTNKEEVVVQWVAKKGCLVTFSFELEDGSVETRTVFVEGVSCEELGL